MHVIKSLCLSLILVGCATAQKQWVPTGGSRADGTVRLSYETHAYERAVTDDAQGVQMARQRCRSWGYEDAEPFGGTTRQCQEQTTYGCSRMLVTAEYQCLGDLEK